MRSHGSHRSTTAKHHHPHKGHKGHHKAHTQASAAGHRRAEALRSSAHTHLDLNPIRSASSIRKPHTHKPRKHHG